MVTASHSALLLFMTRMVRQANECKWWETNLSETFAQLKKREKFLSEEGLIWMQGIEALHFVVTPSPESFSFGLHPHYFYSFSKYFNRSSNPSTVDGTNVINWWKIHLICWLVVTYLGFPSVDWKHVKSTFKVRNQTFFKLTFKQQTVVFGFVGIHYSFLFLLFISCNKKGNDQINEKVVPRNRKRKSWEGGWRIKKWGGREEGREGIIQYNEIECEERERGRTSLVGLWVLFKDFLSLFFLAILLNSRELERENRKGEEKLGRTS